MISPMSYRYRLGLAMGLLGTAVFAGGLAQSQDQPTTVPSVTQPHEPSVMLPPPNPPQGSTAAQSQTNAGPAVQSNRSDSQALPTPPQPPSATGRQAMESDTMKRAQLGVFLYAAEGPGVRIGSVTPGSAADAAGIQPGDFLLGMNGQAVDQPQEVIDRIHQLQPGDSVELRIWRDGREQTLNATLLEQRRVVQSEFVPSGGYIDGTTGVVIDEGVTPVYRRTYRYYPRYYSGPYGFYGYRPAPYYYGYPYSYQYYGTPRFGYYRSPWNQGVQVGPFSFGWR
jgi:hypothetical protein